MIKDMHGNFVVPGDKVAYVRGRRGRGRPEIAVLHSYTVKNTHRKDGTVLASAWATFEVPDWGGRTRLTRLENFIKVG